MSVDKLVDSTQLDSDLTSVANAIRTKGGTSASLAFPADFVSAIGAIPSGGGGTPVWNRPSDWPDIDQLDISGGNIIYMTYSAAEDIGYCDITCKTSSGQYKVEIGTVSGSTFTAETTYNIDSNTACRHYFGSALGGYKVLRISGNLTDLNMKSTGYNSYDGQYRYANSQGLLEVRGKAQNLTGITFQDIRFTERIYLYGSSVASFYNSFRGCASLVIAELPYVVTSACTTLNYMFNTSYALKKVDTTGWDTSGVENMSEVFYQTNCLADVGDISGWDTSAATTFRSLFNGCRLLRKSIDISRWDMSSAATTQEMFRNCNTLTGSLTIPATIQSINTFMFNGARQIFEYHFKSTTPPPMENTNAFANMNDAGGKKIYVPYSADHSVLNAYKTASNWSTYASYIYEEAAP